MASSGQPTLASTCKRAKLSNPKTSAEQRPKKGRRKAEERPSFLAEGKGHLKEAASDGGIR